MRLCWILIAAAFFVGEVYAQQVDASRHEYAKGGGGTNVSVSAVSGSRVPCRDGSAAGFECRNVDLLSYLPIAAIGGASSTELNDVWGWSDPKSGREFALVGRTDGTSFVDVSDPVNPVYLGDLPSHDSTQSIWRDIKVLGHHAVIVADNPVGPDRRLRPHGMQVFDLHRLRDVENAPVTFTADHLYDRIGKAHNIAVNTETEFAYAVGSETCGGGLHMIDMSDPLEPSFAGCFAHLGTGRHGTGYTHDVQCVVYHGPDTDYQGREICFGSNETQVSIADVTDKSNPIPISLAEYPSVQYTHQAWLTPDHRHLLLDDELDEANDPNVTLTRTLIFDVADLDDPQFVTEYFGTTGSIDHNQYVVGDLVFQANYTSGLRVVDISDIKAPYEVGYFDTYPDNDALGYRGAWSNYPFFESGVVIVSSINEGLFVLDPVGPAATSAGNSDLPDTFTLLSAYPNPFNASTTIRLQVDRPQHVHVAVYDVQGKEVASILNEYVDVAGTREFSFHAGDLASGLYVVRARGERAAGTITVTLQK